MLIGLRIVLKNHDWTRNIFKKQCFKLPLTVLFLHCTKTLDMKKQLLFLTLLLAFVGLGSRSLACQASFTWNADSTGGIYFTNTSTGTYSNVSWSFGDGTASSQMNPYHQYNATSWYLVCLTVWDSSGCQSSVCDTVYSGAAFPNCMASFQSSVQGNTVTFTNLSTGTYQGYSFNYGDNTTGTSFQHTYAQPGVYTVCLNIGTNFASPCSDTYCATIVISGTSNCNAQFTSIDTMGGVLFMPQVYQSNWTYSWAFGDGGISSNPYPTHSYNAPGTYLACLTVTNAAQNCTVTYCDSIYVANATACQAAFSLQVGANGQVNFYGYNANGPALGGTWFWNFGDGTTATGQNPSHQFTSNGIYNVCLTIQVNGCTDVYCYTVAINNVGVNCNPQFTVNDSVGVYYFIPAVFSGNYDYFWSFGDGTTSTAPWTTHTYTGSGPWVVCLTVIDSSQGCSAVSCDTVYGSSVPPIPCQSYFSYFSDSTGNVSFYNASVGSYSNVLWSFGDGTSSTSFNPMHAYSGSGPYVVCLTIFGNAPGNPCQSSWCDTIFPSLNANSCVPVFYTYPDSSLFGTGTVNFTLMNPCQNTTYVWNFGDGTVVTTTNGTVPPHQYAATGWYNVCVLATTASGFYNYCNQVYALRLSAGINQVEKIDATIFPNPAKESATLRFVASGETTMEVMGLDGRMVSTQNAGSLSGEVQLNVDFTTLENGLYFVRLYSGDQRGMVKVMVQH